MDREYVENGFPAYRLGKFRDQIEIAAGRGHGVKLANLQEARQVCRAALDIDRIGGQLIVQPG